MNFKGGEIRVNRVFHQSYVLSSRAVSSKPAALSTTGPSSRNLKAIHVGTSPLVGLDTLIDMLPHAAARRAMQLHHFVVFESFDGSCELIDFLPLDPTSPSTAMTLALMVRGSTDNTSLLYHSQVARSPETSM